MIYGVNSKLNIEEVCIFPAPLPSTVVSRLGPTNTDDISDLCFLIDANSASTDGNCSEAVSFEHWQHLLPEVKFHFVCSKSIIKNKAMMYRVPSMTGSPPCNKSPGNATM